MTDIRTARADTLPGSYTVVREGPRDRGARRDRTMGELRVAHEALKAHAARLESTVLTLGQAMLADRDRLTILEGFVDTLATTLAAVRRHGQFHHNPDEVAGCGICHPMDEEKDLDADLQAAARRDALEG